METGMIRSFYKPRGYGFIIPDDGRLDVFLHISAFQDNPESELDILQLQELAGLRVEFKAQRRFNSGGEMATLIKRERRHAKR
jgi:cold shock CspA family protein